MSENWIGSTENSDLSENADQLADSQYINTYFCTRDTRVEDVTRCIPVLEDITHEGDYGAN